MHRTSLTWKFGINGSFIDTDFGGMIVSAIMTFDLAALCFAEPAQTNAEHHCLKSPEALRFPRRL